MLEKTPFGANSTLPNDCMDTRTDLVLEFKAVGVLNHSDKIFPNLDRETRDLKKKDSTKNNGPLEYPEASDSHQIFEAQNDRNPVGFKN